MYRSKRYQLKILDDRLNTIFYLYISLVSLSLSVDTQLCIHNLILRDDQNNHFKYPKVMIAFHALRHSSHIIKWSWDSNATICLASKSDCRIKRYYKIKFSQSACFHLDGTGHKWLNEINFDWLMIKINKMSFCDW